MRGAANSAGKGGGPWRYYNPQDDKTETPPASKQEERKTEEEKIDDISD